MLRAGPLVQPGKHTRLDLLLGHRRRTPQLLAQQLLRVIQKIESNPQILAIREQHRPQSWLQSGRVAITPTGNAEQSVERSR